MPRRRGARYPRSRWERFRLREARARSNRSSSRCRRSRISPVGEPPPGRPTVSNAGPPSGPAVASENSANLRLKSGACERVARDRETRTVNIPGGHQTGHSPRKNAFMLRNRRPDRRRGALHIRHNAPGGCSLIGREHAGPQQPEEGQGDGGVPADPNCGVGHGQEGCREIQDRGQQ